MLVNSKDTLDSAMMVIVISLTITNVYYIAFFLFSHSSEARLIIISHFTDNTMGTERFVHLPEVTE